MKKKLVTMLVATISVSTLFGCGASNESATDNSSAVDSATEDSSTSDDSTDAASEGDSTSDSASTDSSVVTFGDDSYISNINVSDYVTLGEYKGITVEVASVNVTDEDVEEEITNTYLPSITNEVTDRAVEEGDTVNIDYVGKYADSGEEFDGGSAEGYDLTIGSGTFIDGFEDGLIGAEIGDTVDLELTFPEDYSNTDLAGVDVIFSVTINSIVEPAEEVTDDNVSSLGITDVTTVKQLKAYVKNLLVEEATQEYQEELESAVIEKAVENATFADEFPEAVVERYVEMFNNSLDYYATMYYYYTGTQMTGDDYLESYLTSIGEDTSDLEAYKLESATEQIEATLVAFAVAEAEGIEITEDEIEEEISSASSSAGYSDNTEYEEYYLGQVGMSVRELVKESLTDEKAVDFLAENAVVVEPSADSADSASTDSSN